MSDLSEFSVLHDRTSSVVPAEGLAGAAAATEGVLGATETPQTEAPAAAQTVNNMSGATVDTQPQHQPTQEQQQAPTLPYHNAQPQPQGVNSTPSQPLEPLAYGHAHTTTPTPMLFMPTGVLPPAHTVLPPAHAVVHIVPSSMGAMLWNGHAEVLVPVAEAPCDVGAHPTPEAQHTPEGQQNHHHDAHSVATHAAVLPDASMFVVPDAKQVLVHLGDVDLGLVC